MIIIKKKKGTYKFALHLCCAAAVLGSVLYALAYRAHWLYLILAGRIVTGVSFAQFFYAKRYCSDPRIVGVRRRTTLAGWLVVGQSAGFTVGPFVGGLLYKVGFASSVFNGYTSPGWVMAAVWLLFWVVIAVWFEDVPRRDVSNSNSISGARSSVGAAAAAADDDAAVLGDISLSTQRPPSSSRRSSEEIAVVSSPYPPRSMEVEPVAAPPSVPTQQPAEDLFEDAPPVRISARRWAVTATMCWFAMMCFFVLGAWEANIPVFSARAFGASPFVAGNLIALGGVCTFPFMFANVVLARRVQDRYILTIGCALGLLGLALALAVVTTTAGHATFGSLFAAWFFVALGFNLASTVTLSLLSKQMPHSWNGKISLFIQYSNYSGRVTGAVWGGAGVDVGMTRYVGLQLALLGIGGLMFMTLWREMKAKTG